MLIVVDRVGVDELGEVVHVLRDWQRAGGPVQLHPGDLGWYWRCGAEAAAAALRTWGRQGRTLAVGLLDGPDLLRLAVAPEAGQDAELARRMAADLTGPEHGVLPGGTASVEVRSDALLRRLLGEGGWEPGESWTPLQRDLAGPVADCGARIEVTTPERAPVRVAVQRAAFHGSTFTDERWRAMAGGLPYTDARCLVAHDDRGRATAAATVWSAGAGRPGLVEPLGVDREHRGRGHGRAIALAAAAALRELGSSGATVCTPSANVAAVATYGAAGFRRLPPVRNLRRRARSSGGADPWRVSTGS